jgi:hypothetical protein
MPGLAGIYAGEALDPLGKMIVGVGPVDDPPACALAVAGAEAETAVVLREVGVFGPDEVEFAFLREDGRGAFVVAFEANAAESLGEASLVQAGSRQRKQRDCDGGGAHDFSHHDRF